MVAGTAAFVGEVLAEAADILPDQRVLDASAGRAPAGDRDAGLRARR
jgi:hypothetical protein